MVQARLWLTSGGPRVGGEALMLLPGYRVDETTATWATLPTLDLVAARDGAGTPILLPWLDGAGPITVDITGVVTADGMLTFVIVGAPELSSTLASRETGSSGPMLEILVQD